MNKQEKISINGVPETMLQTMYARAKETKKENAVIHDEKNSGRVCSCYAGRKVECRQSISKTLPEKFIGGN